VASNSSYLFIAGGCKTYVEMVDGSPEYSDEYSGEVVRYNTSMTRSTGFALPYNGSQICSVSLPNYAIFAGGRIPYMEVGLTATMCYYDTSGTCVDGRSLAAVKANVAGAAAGNCPIFAGGISTDGATAQVTAYNSSLTRVSMADLTIPRENIAPCSVGDYAVFYGGKLGNAAVATVEAYNSSLTKVSVP
jgi:hypothetical protein